MLAAKGTPGVSVRKPMTKESDTARVERQYAKLDAEGKRALLRTLRGREVVRGMKFAKTRSVKDNAAHSLTRRELSYVRTQMRLEGLL